jgi:hypothetical protein
MTHHLPEALAEIAEAAGEAAAVMIAARQGGCYVYIPAKVDDGHWLVDCVGRRAADRICAHFAVDGIGARIYIPLYGGGAYPTLRRSIAKRVHDLHNDGASSAEISRRIGVTQRTVHRHRRAHRGGGEDDQGSLL